MGRNRGGGGRGRRNQFYATGLTGWQRAGQADAPQMQAGAAQDGAVARIESALADVLARLDGLKAASKKR